MNNKALTVLNCPLYQSRSVVDNDNEVPLCTNDIYLLAMP